MTKNEKITHRIKIIKGHLNKLEQMIEEHRYCVDVMTQGLAIQKSLQSLNQMILERHLSTCVKEQFISGKTDKAVTELTHLYHLSQI